MFTEKRGFVRGNFFCKITAIFGERLLVFNSYTENISEGGLKIFLEEKLYVSTIVDLELLLAENEAPIKCQGEIVWVNEIPSQENGKECVFDTGIKFREISQRDKKKISDIVKKVNFTKNGGNDKT